MVVSIAGGAAAVLLSATVLAEARVPRGEGLNSWRHASQAASAAFLAMSRWAAQALYGSSLLGAELLTRSAVGKACDSSRLDHPQRRQTGSEFASRLLQHPVRKQIQPRLLTIG